MDLKVFKDTFTSLGCRWEGRAEIPIDTELLIPDYLPPVFKVVKCMFYLVVLQKGIAGSRLRLEGYLRCTVLYQSEEQGLCQTEQKIPFEKMLELPQAEFSASRVSVSGSAEYSNCRAVNQRRMEVRGAYIVQAELCPTRECELVSSLAGGGVEQLQSRFGLLRNLSNLDKLMTNEETVHLPEDLGCVIEISGYGEVEECRLLGGKAVVKGRTEVQLVYTRREHENIENLSVTVPFNQILDFESINESSLCSAVVETVGCSLNAEQEEESVTVASLLRLSVYEQAEGCAVQDAFSTQYETQTEYETLVCAQLADRISLQLACTGQILLPEPDAVYIGCFTAAGPLHIQTKGDKAVGEGMVTLNLIYKNSMGEYMCTEQELAYCLPQDYPGPGEQYSFDGGVQVCGVQCRQNGNEVQAEVRLQANGLLMRACSHKLLAKIECGEEWPQAKEIALRIYFAHAGEQVFEIAKRYHACAAAVQQCNGLEAPVLEADRHILIPKAN